MRGSAWMILAGWLFVHAEVSAELPRVPELPAVDARGYVLIDHHSGAVLAEQRADERLEPASLTKIMTAFVVAEELARGRIALGDQVRVSEEAWRTEGSRMFIEPGRPVTVDELLHGVIIQSGNDASVALAQHVAGSQAGFGALMREHAAQLGMTSSGFANPDGLPDPGNYSTARDMARLTSALVRRHPTVYALFSTREYSYNGITQKNRNKLLGSFDGADGVKTGHTEAAGYCLVSSAERGGMRLIAVVMGSASDAKRVEASRVLLEHGFRWYETHRLYGAATPLAQLRVWQGATPQVGVALAEDLYVTIPRGAYPLLTAAMDLPKSVVAPITAGQPLGRVVLTLDGKPLLERPLGAQSDVPAAGILWRMVDAARMWFE